MHLDSAWLSASIISFSSVSLVGSATLDFCLTLINIFYTKHQVLKILSSRCLWKRIYHRLIQRLMTFIQNFSEIWSIERVYLDFIALYVLFKTYLLYAGKTFIPFELNSASFTFFSTFFLRFNSFRRFIPSFATVNISLQIISFNNMLRRCYLALWNITTSSS